MPAPRLENPSPATLRQRRYREVNREKEREYQRRYRQEHGEERARAHREYQKRKRDELFAEMVEAYGGGCSCCGLDDPAFLTLEHVGGMQGRPRISVLNELAKLKREGWPDRCTCFCFNCNLGSWRNGGTCPHQQEVR